MQQTLEHNKELASSLHELHFGFVSDLEDLQERHAQEVAEFFVKNADALGITAVNLHGRINDAFKFLYPACFNADPHFVGDVTCRVASVLCE